MKVTIEPCLFEKIRLLRDLYREEMRCQIVHDSLHLREGWTQPYFLEADGSAVGYCSILVGGPWTGTRTIFEFYVLPAYRTRIFALFSATLESTEATGVEAQSSDTSLSVMLHARCRDIRSEKIVFEDGVLTLLPSAGAMIRKLHDRDLPKIFAHHREPVGDYILEVGSKIVATGGVAWHYNRPYGDIFMEVDGGFRRQGFGAYLVQELKRLCYQSGGIPCARCSTGDVASVRTIQKAGFIPTSHILVGSVCRSSV